MDATGKLTFEELVEQIKAKAAACETTKDARDLYLSTPHDSTAEDIYGVRWAELEDADAPAKAAACETIHEAQSLFQSVPGWSNAKKIYKARCDELAEQRATLVLAEISARAKSCKTALQTRSLIALASGDEERKIYEARLIEFLNAEAPAKAAACRTSIEAAVLCNNVPIGSEAMVIYQARYVELSKIEAPAKAAACETAEEARKLKEDLRGVLEVEAIYETRWMELHLQGK